MGVAGAAPAQRRRRRLVSALRPHLRLDELEPAVAEQLEELLDQLATVWLVPDDPSAQLTFYAERLRAMQDVAALTDMAAQEVLATAATELAVKDWQAAWSLRGVLAHRLGRRLAGDGIAAHIELPIAAQRPQGKATTES